MSILKHTLAGAAAVAAMLMVAAPSYAAMPMMDEPLNLRVAGSAGNDLVSKPKAEEKMVTHKKTIVKKLPKKK